MMVAGNDIPSFLRALGIFDEFEVMVADDPFVSQELEVDELK